MSENELRHCLIVNKIKHATRENEKGFTIQTLLYNENLLNGIRESEIREAVNWAIRKGIINIETKERFGDTVFIFSNSVALSSFDDSINISVTAPRSSNYSLGEIIDRNGFITTVSTFKQIISSAKQAIRISSPFLQRNVTNVNSLPELDEILLSAFRRGCRIVILSREARTRRGSDLAWIMDLARNNGFTEKLEIFDYHKSKKSGEIDSSTHAKLIIADEEIAYIGSAELRLNSLYKNFEVGVMLRGPMIIGLIELFDTMTSVAKRVY